MRPIGALLMALLVVSACVLIAGCTSPSGNATTQATTSPTTMATGTPTSAETTAAANATATNTTATTAGTNASTTYTVMTSSSGQLGTYLVDGNGVTLYNFTTDSKDTSSCSGACVNVWPVFYASSINVPSDLNASDFTSFTRSDGSMQTAYKGMPLYYYAADTSPGQATGQGLYQFGGYWYVVPPDSPGYS
jgi:predicted lipoprotein with Yx(FWY)xxD motif